MSGQHDSYLADVHCLLDGPPRVWGVRGLNVIAVPDLGYTPTHVGKTASSNCTRRQPRNDPYVRGEDTRLRAVIAEHGERDPHVREEGPQPPALLTVTRPCFAHFTGHLIWPDR